MDRCPLPEMTEEDWRQLLAQADEHEAGPLSEQEQYLRWRDREHTCPDCLEYAGDCLCSEAERSSALAA